jgi:LPXTG-motif cell wall-anchored protein
MIENISGTVLPETGGIGTEIYTFTGIALLAIGALLLLKKRRSHSSAN